MGLVPEMANRAPNLMLVSHPFVFDEFGFFFSLLSYEGWTWTLCIYDDDDRSLI